MAKYLLWRVAQAVVVVFVVTIVVFFLLHQLPGGPARGILGIQATAEQIQAFEHEQGLDQPLPVQYFHFLGRLLSGDLGESYQLNQRVGDLIAARLPRTLVLTVLSTLVSLVIAVPLGIWQAVRRNRPTDYVLSVLALLMYSTPVFLVGFILLIVFALNWGIFPVEAPQAETLGGIFADSKALILPVLTGATTTVAIFSRYLRSSVVDNLDEDYVRTARAKGASEARILRRHVLKNSLTSVVAMLGYYLPVLFGGALVIEKLFNFPGMGLLFWNAAQTSDFPILLGVVLMISVATVVGSLLADVAQALIDPRTRRVRT
ncbi:ABC transporter permease [Actinocrispum wychmicini]|uniref:Peptide/nickel transport system permease protein n=1 Tax=Actinocrispum wychmicini TaxID=1213861 RepID=A0A4R2JLL6_9PSEU|nr:ABC transporter permease [Actinocrispum wychmicini]TCO57976.1 peptide/nickel transport system permease protein [Actinocrispum wychmicini]